MRVSQVYVPGYVPRYTSKPLSALDVSDAIGRGSLLLEVEAVIRLADHQRLRVELDLGQLTGFLGQTEFLLWI